jgi:hypothetical protein
MSANEYLISILAKYKARDISVYAALSIPRLMTTLKTWAGGCFIATLESGSRAKGTAISLASDVDYLVSLTSNCNENQGGLKEIYESLYRRLRSEYEKCRKQNVSIRIQVGTLEVDITPARKQPGSTNNHWIYVSKKDTRTQTNIQKHIVDISSSGRINEIKLLKIWRELHHLDFPSIYLEYLLINNVLLYKSKGIDNLQANMIHIFHELAKDSSNPLFSRIVDPANSSNILSDLLSDAEKNLIIREAKKADSAAYWSHVVW